MTALGAVLGMACGAAAADDRPPELTSVAVTALLDEPYWAELAEETPAPPPPAYSWKPYGFLWADMIAASNRTFPGAFTLWVPSASEQGEPAFVIDARRSRVGLNVGGPGLPAIADSTAGGRIEIDFHGAFNGTENRGGVLLRQAYGEIVSPEWRFLFGQTDDVISPLNPSTLNYAVGYAAGNVGFRRAQFRIEHYREIAEGARTIGQFALNQDVVADFATDAGIRREPTGWPVSEARVALEMKTQESGPPLSFGLSGHIGATQFDFLTPGPPPNSLPPADDQQFLSWSFHVDWIVPVSPHARLRGEFFHGANLTSYWGGIGQGVCACLRVPIRSTGGWVEWNWDWNATWHSAIGYGLDDPLNRDSLIGRVYNQMWFANVWVDVTEKLMTGFEVAVWDTHYHDLRVGQIPPDQLTPSLPGESVTVQWTVRYGF
ncbi:MAG: hypothetical protein U0939_22990 [Pirellulales bacterium]